MNEKSFDLNRILKLANQSNASDLHIKPGLPPIFRINGELLPIRDVERFSPDLVDSIAKSIMNQEQQIIFHNEKEIDFSYGVPGLGRYRVNIHKQRGTTGIVLRVIPFAITSLSELFLPNAIFTRVVKPNLNGLILVTGTTGSGKTTTLAALIDLINQTRKCHIITIEDPIEFLHRDKKAIITQREIGSDTESYAKALRSALRQDPDVILIGEMRDFETIDIAIKAAETGHLVLSTLHTIDATETIARIITEFPERQQQQIRLQLGTIIKGIISQRLIPRADGKGRVPAAEILENTSRIRSYIEDKDKTKGIQEAIAQGYIQTFDQSLMMLLKKQFITQEEALRQCANPADFKLKLSGIESSHDSTKWGAFDKAERNSEGEETPPDDDLEIERF